MTPKLVVTSGKSAGRTIAVKREKLLVGRADECDVRPLSEEVSRRHCAFHVEADSLVVEDLRSRNGTFVNGSRIEGRRPLVDGDIVRIGNLELKVACRAAADPPSQRAAAASENEDEVSRWLMADDEPAGMYDTTRALRVANEQTVPIPPDATPKNPAVGDAAAEKPQDKPDSETTVIRGRTPAPATAGGAGQKKSADTSRAAAAEALKKFFNNR
jgi:predicted component of type VI protein secretion system